MTRDAIQNILNLVLDNVPQAIFWKDLNSVYLGCNKAFASGAGLAHPDEIVGKTDFDLPWTREESEVFRADDRDVMRNNAAKMHIVLRRRNIAGEHIWVEASKMPLTDGGKVFGVLGVYENITERQQAEEALRESEARYRTIQKATAALLHRNQVFMQNAIDGIHVLDIQGNLVEANDSFCKMLGYKTEEVKCLNVSDWDKTWTAEELLERIRKIVLAGDSVTFETVHCRKDGSLINTEISCTGMEIGRQYYLFCASRDISGRKDIETERQMLLTQLLQSQKMESIGHLAGGIAHDFNNMLGAMLGYTELIKQASTGASQKRVHKYSDEILTAGNRAKELISQMLMFSSPHQDSREVPITSLQPALKEVVYLLRASIPSSIEIHYHIEEAELSARIQPVHLHQILMNLLINARDAIGDHGRIDVRLSSRTLSGICASCHASFSGDYVQLSVKDSGSGISEQQLSKIFDPYFSTKGVGKGTGMGLSVVHGIVHALGGHIAVASEVGRGTTFRLMLLKATVTGKQEQAIAVPDTVDNMLSGLRIMVVDDEHAMSSMLYELLSMHGAEVTVYNLPMEALADLLCNQDKFDLVITDEAMPDISGFDMAKAMLHEKPNLPILLCTGYSEHVNADIARQNGIAGFMVKPLETQKLLQWIKAQALFVGVE